MARKQPYTNTVSNYFLIAVVIALIISLSSCATTKRDCQGVKHTKQKGGFYL